MHVPFALDLSAVASLLFGALRAAVFLDAESGLDPDGKCDAAL
jgi:hypothetical protein